MSKTIQFGEVKYTLLDETIATIDDNGKIIGKDGVSGITKLNIADVTNDYETEITIVVNRLENTNTITYIYSAEDLVKFRDSVNAGNNYAGKTVYVMADIDLSTVCSASLGSFTAIGANGTRFAGTFAGNYHKISNLYATSSSSTFLGLFATVENAIIQNVRLENAYIYNSTSINYTGGITGTAVNSTISNCYTSGTIIGRHPVGGIVAHITSSNIIGCINNATVKTLYYNSTYKGIAGGIVGMTSGKVTIDSCYNKGTIIGNTASCQSTGGIIGHVSSGTVSGSIVKNCYNIGTISTSGSKGGIISGFHDSGKITATNNYWLTGCGATYGISGKKTNTGATSTAATTLKTYATTLGKLYESDDYTINSGYPILWWEAPSIELNKKQTYIKKEEKLQLNLILNETATRVLGENSNTSDFTWTSTNEDIATVNENGTVTGLKDGYTTIYAYHEKTGLYAMCVVNVATETANPQIEIGNGFTVILKADGTVWTIGNNENGTLGDGSNQDTLRAVQVKIDDNTYLNNIIKISAGTNHVTALTKDGKVYAWGANSYGQLGQNDTEASNYAKLVLGEGGEDSLDRIVDIAAGSYGTVAVNEYGWCYVWGNGTYGEIGNGTNTVKYIPTKNTLNTAISVSMGEGHLAVIEQNGDLYTCGRNTYGELGLGNTTNYTSMAKTADGVTEVTACGYETILKQVDGSIYVTGLNTNGQLGLGNTTNVNVWTKINLPTTVTNTNQVKYIKAGRTSTSLMLTDGTVWTVGNNINGELGDKTNTTASNFVQTQIKEENVTNTLIIGRSNGDTTSLNTALINESGRVYTAGSNTYGQIGDDTQEDKNYFTVMGYSIVEYETSIKMHVGETKQLTSEEFAYVENYFNVYQEDKIKVSLVDNTQILDSYVATYEDGLICAKNIGTTMLMVKEEETGTLVYIPVEVLPENGMVNADIKTGEDFTVSLKANGTVWTFGTNTNGELGLGDTTNRNIPKQVSLLEEKVIIQIAVGTSHVIALTEDGEIYTWGGNSNGQLGIDTTQNSNIPQKLENLGNTKEANGVEGSIVKVIANKNVSYAISQSGKVYAWGEGYGQTPKLLELEDIIDISSQYALDIYGNVYCLETSERLEIVEKIKYISEGNTHTVFLSENGTAYAIGSNTYGQFGDGTNISSTNSVIAVRNEDLTDILRNIVKIEAGEGYTTAVLSDGRLLTWGINRSGQLGNEEVDEIYTVSENTNITKLLSSTNENIIWLDAGANHIAMALSDGNVYTWGLGKDGQLGNGKNEDEILPQLVGKNIVETNTNHLLLSINDTFDIEATTSYFNLLQDIDGEISYESRDESVITVDNTTGLATARSQGTTVIIAREVGTTNIAVIQVRVLPEEITIEPQVATNGSHTVTLKVDGTVWCYGNNTNGELGNGTTNISDEPVQAIFPEGTTIVQIAAGENFSVALDSEGKVWTWGANDYNQLGNSTSSYETTPIKVEGIDHITKIAAGTYSVLAINENKEVYGWGLNSNGELGIGSYTNKVSIPTKAKYITDAIDIAIGKNHSILLKSTGEVQASGLNIYGQLGNSDTSIKKTNLFTKIERLTSVARISATDAGNIVSTVNGEVYTWGLNIYGELGQGDKTNRYAPTLVDGMENIIQVSGGKNHSILLDKTGKVYTSGSNTYGQLGNGTITESLTYQEVSNLSKVMAISSGNTYTVIAKEDGTVWGFGDYNHGDITLKSKTKSLVPIQVGNDSFGLDITKITIRKSETATIASSIAYSFNLLYLEQNKTENITYESLNEEIAMINEYGEVLGVREGLTWIKVIEENGTEHVVYVYVTDNETDYSPVIQAGEDFAAVLKADGSIWTFGHNNNGELGIGSNKTKDIPEKTNVISSYQDIASGDNFTVAIRSDRTVWSFGKNTYGQLGTGTTKNGLNPVQVNGITDIVQIATGKEHVVALDDYGILYGWGNNKNGQLGLSSEMVLTPTPIGFTESTISSIWAGEDETIIINTKGQVYGYGSILNGKLEGIENAVKVGIGNGYMLILTTDGEVYQYTNGTLTKYTQLAQIVDIDVTNANNIAQTLEEKVYTWKANENLTLEEIENVYTIAAGTNNNYVILTDGTVYAKGQNQYGQLGNSTREDSEEFTLVGDRTFTIEPETAIMYVNDVETLTEEITVNEFNVFNRRIRNTEEYTWESTNENIVKVADGKLTAIAEGTAKITVTDHVTEAEVVLTRVVIPVEKDRIESITINDNQATIQEEYKYYVEVETNHDTAVLEITTKDKTDKISIDGGTTWYENGILTSEINIPNEENEISMIVETSNGTQIEYTLVVKKIETDVSLERLTIDGIQATPTAATQYEVVVPEETDISEIIAKTKSNKAEVSINGEAYAFWEATSFVTYEHNLELTVPIIVKAENGDELEYRLTIYKESAILQLESLSVEGKEAIKTSEKVYSVTIARDLNTVDVTAKAVSSLVNVAINDNNFEIQVSTKSVKITEELTEVSIRLSTTIEEEEVYRDYTLNIYKKLESGKLEFVIVNETVVTPNVDGTYEIYLPEETEKATVKVIAQNEQDYVQIETNEPEKTVSEVEVTTPEDSNSYTIKVMDEDGNVEEYILYIKKPSADATLKQITVSNGDDIVTASKSTEEENVYIAKVKAYDNYTIVAVTSNVNAYVGIDGNELTKNVDTKVIAKTDNTMEILICVQSENGDMEEYTLKIELMSSDKSLEFLKVNEVQATLQENGTYLVNLETAETQVSLEAQTTNELASIKVQGEEYERHNTIKNITIDAKDTITYIYVQAEDGTTQKYMLIISGLPDDSTLQKVVVNGLEAKYIEGENKYEIRSDATGFNIEAFATDSLASVSLNETEVNIGSSTITVNKAGEITTVIIKVTAQDGIDSSTYTLEIKEKSNDTSIAKVAVNGQVATKLLDGNYTANVTSNVTSAVIKVEANDSYATVYLEEETQNASNLTVTKTILDRETVYIIKVVAEDGTAEEYTLTITKLSGNTDMKELSVMTTVEREDEETGEITTIENVEILTPDENGNYYLKIDRVQKATVKAILSDPKASVKINNANYVLAENTLEVETAGEQIQVNILVQAEDGTIKTHILTLEKKSNDTTLKTITSEDMLKLEEYTMYVDESLDQIDLTIVTNNDYAYLKLADEMEYTAKQITRTIDLTQEPNTDEENAEGEEGWLVSISVKAEDGTLGEHIIKIIKTGNVNIISVKANDEEVMNVNDIYTTRVTVADTANIEITAENESAIIEILKITTDEETEEVTETVLASGVGILVADVNLTEDPENYTIRITSEAGSSVKDYELILEQKSTDTTISYVKVDNLNAIENAEGNYITTVSKDEIYPLIIKLNDEKAFVKIAYKDYEGTYIQGKLEDNLPVADGETLEVMITVQAENGNEETYILSVTRISTNTELEYVKVNGDTVTDFNPETATYTIIIDNTLTEANIETKAISEKAKVTIESVTDMQIVTTSTTLPGEGKTKTLTIKVEAEDGSIEEYTLNIYQKSKDVTLDKITVNGETVILKEETGKYEIEITDEVKEAEIIAIAGASTSKVSIAGNTAKEGSNTKIITIEGHAVIEMIITIEAEDNTTQDYNLKITVKESSKEISYVKVNTGEVTPEEDKITYQTFIDNKAVNSNIEIKTASEYANIEIINQENLTISNESLQEGILTFTVDTPKDVTILYYRVTSEAGETKDYTIILMKISTDNSLKELYVNEQLIEVNEDGNYYYNLENPGDVTIKAIANNEYANIRIDYNEEEKHQTQAGMYIQNQSTKVTITITSQAGVTVKYYLYIRVLANNTDLDKVVIDSSEVENYVDNTKTYTAIVDNSKDTYEVFLMAVNDQATVELYNGEELITSGVGSLTDLITLGSLEDAHEYQIKVSLDEEHYSTYTLAVIRTSNDISLKLVEVNDVVREPTENDKTIYEVGIPELADTARIKIQTTNSQATVRIGDNEPVKGGETVTVNISLSEDRVTVPVVVTAVNGTTVATYNIILIRQSNDVSFEYVKVNEEEIENVNDEYTYYMSVEENIAHVEIAMVDNASVEVDENIGIGYLEFDVKFDEDTIKVEKIIQVTSEDGTVEKEYTLIITKKTQIKGTIITENLEEKHIVTISLYQTGDENLVTQIATKEDGSFELNIEKVGTYDIIVTKLGYLSYTVTNIEILPGSIIELDSYQLLAGDVIETGDIEIDDLVDLNEHYGLTINHEDGVNDENVKYDFNEDGKIDSLDRNILKKNYGKLAETIVWINPNALIATFTMARMEEEISSETTTSETKEVILPMNCSYTITSDYGYRIHPTTGEYKKHTGIDLSGIHHIEILAVADGEVTFAGIQSGFGNCVEIKHVVNGEAIYSFYAHLSRIDVQQGEIVEQGQTIGLEGGDPETDPNPGSSTGHHLHFEIRKASGYGNDVNPNDYIKF